MSLTAIPTAKSYPSDTTTMTTHHHTTLTMTTNPVENRREEAHLGITIRWAGAPWPAPGTRPALLIFIAGELILVGGSRC